MRPALALRSGTGFLLLVGGCSVALAQNPAVIDGLSGGIVLGLRSVDTSGAVNKYREDINLDDGVRVLDLALDYEAPSADTLVDRIHVTAANLGGDPFEAAHVEVRKFGSYRLRLDRFRSEYFYDDTILPPPLASINASTGGDFHRFDFERVRESAALDITVSPQTQVSLGLLRQTRTGDSTTTLDIQRDEFELDRPLDESLNALNLGVTHGWDKVRLSFEEEVREFENASQIFLPGASPGANTTDPAELQYFFLDQFYDYKSRGHTLRLIAEPAERVDLSALWRREDLDLDLAASESALGTDYTGVPFSTDVAGPADVGRDSEVAGIDAGYAIGSRARLIAGIRTSTLDQSGALAFGADQGSGDWRIETDGYELGAEYAFGSKLILAAGWSSESRDTAYTQLLNATGHSEFVTTDRDGFFVRLRFETANDVELTAAVEDNSIDDPFALASPTASRRYRVSLRHAWDNGLALSGGYRQTDVDNTTSGWAADTRQTNLRLSYRTGRLELSAGYSDVDLDRDISQLVTAGSVQALYAIAYRADSSFADASVRWSWSERTMLGGSLRSYENQGSFAVERDDWRAFLAHVINDSYSVEFSYRSIDYVEDLFDDFDADILEAAVRLSW